MDSTRDTNSAHPVPARPHGEGFKESLSLKCEANAHGLCTEKSSRQGGPVCGDTSGCTPVGGSHGLALQCAGRLSWDEACVNEEVTIYSCDEREAILQGSKKCNRWRETYS